MELFGSSWGIFSRFAPPPIKTHRWADLNETVVPLGDCTYVISTGQISQFCPLQRDWAPLGLNPRRMIKEACVYRVLYLNRAKSYRYSHPDIQNRRLGNLTDTFVTN